MTPERDDPAPIRAAASNLDGWDGRDWDVWRSARAEQARRALDPLLALMRLYDQLRLRLQQRGGSLGDLNQITSLLTRPVELQGPYRCHQVSLGDPPAIQEALRDLGELGLRHEVRRSETLLPLFYLCRVHTDYWGEYSLVVEDLHLSPGYPVHDPRFVKLMGWGGHERYYLRLSPLRQGVEALAPDGRRSREQTDLMLNRVGRHVLSVSWHEDQRLAQEVARHFEAPELLEAIELLYLCLGGDLCRLRSAVQPWMMEFFHRVEPRPAMAAFLESMGHSDGESLLRLPQAARTLYRALSVAFSRFLRVNASTWGRAPGRETPLHKLIFANLDRLHLVGPRLRDQPAVRRSARELVDVANRVLQELLDPRSDS